jgi:FG-GAP repeat
MTVMSIGGFMKGIRRTTLSLLIVALVVAARVEAQEGTSSRAMGDFNGDGFADLAIGVPGEDTPAGTGQSGAVNIIYGSANGLTGNGSVPTPRFFSQNAAGVPGDGSEPNDFFGAALAAGDFNRDRFSDLAIGVPFEDVEGYGDSGRVVIIYGSANGLTATDGIVPGSQSFTILDLENYSSVLEGWEEFGRALAVGDFNGDTIADLAVGAPGLQGRILTAGGPCFNCPPNPDGANSEPLNGAVFVLFGISGVGLSAERAQFLHLPDDGDRGYTDFRFGEALAAGNFDGDADNVSDLAIGIPNHDIQGVQNAGSVMVRFGRLADGFQNSLSTVVSPEALVPVGQPGSNSQAGAQFGRALAAGDFDGDGTDDLAIGAPRRAIGTRRDAGAVWVIQDIMLLFGLPLPAVQFWEQSTIFPNATLSNELNGVGTPTEAGDLFGTALAAGDFNGDGRDDLAIGAPGEDIAIPTPDPTIFLTTPGQDAGVVTVINGSPRGLSLTQQAPQLWQQGLFGAGDVERGDQFGASLTAWNFGRDESIPGVAGPVRTADLAVGVPGENLPVGGRDIIDCGQVNVIYGSFGRGLTTTGVQRWHQGSHPDLGGREASDAFGWAVH